MGDTSFKCSSPIRDAASKENLWEALLVMPSPIHRQLQLTATLFELKILISTNKKQ